MEHKDFTPEMLEDVEKKLRDFFIRVVGCAPERLKELKLFDPGMAGKSGLMYRFEPALSAEEHRRVDEALRFMSKALGGGPPIAPAQA